MEHPEIVTETVDVLPELLAAERRAWAAFDELTRDMWLASRAARAEADREFFFGPREEQRDR